MKDFIAARENMVRTQIVLRGIRDTRVIQAMREVQRERFVPEPMKSHAYDDSALSIGEGQTISQPYIVALMTEALELNGEEKVLEIGTGSGYQAAILARLTGAVYTVERIESLMNEARKVLDEQGYKNIFYKVFDGTLGWSEESPYDAIVVTAGAPVVPNPLLDQLKENGRLVLPVGDQYGQDLVKITKKGGKFYQQSLGGVIFVKLIGEYGWSK